jgi:hypothetical protein
LKYLYLLLLLLTSPSWATSYTAVSGGGNWSNNATWGGGGHPVAGDTAVLASTSGSVTVDTASACAVVTCGGYTNATGLVVNNNLTTTAGVTLASGAGYSQAAGATWIAAASTYNFASKTLTNLQLNSTGNFTFTAATTPTVNNLSVANGFTATLVTNAPALGTGSVSMGTGILAGLTLTVGGSVNQTIQTSSTGYISSNLTFNTSGSVTILNTFNYGTGTLTYTAGTMVVTGSTLNLVTSTTLATSGMTWNSITMPSGTYTNTSAINISGGTLLATGAATLATNGVNITGSGAVSVATSASLNGSAVTMTGNSSIQTAGTGLIASGLTFNAPGATVTLNGVVNYATGTMTYTAGSVNSASATLNFTGTATENMGSGVTIANVQFSGSNVTHTLTSGNFYITNCIVNNTGSCASATNAFDILGNLYFTNTGTMYGAWNYVGSGAVTCISTGGLGTGTLNINTSGTVTFSGNFYINNPGTFSYTAGTVVNNLATAPCTINMGANFTFTDSHNIWPYLHHNTGGAVTATLTDPMTITSLQNAGTGGLVFGTSALTCSNTNTGGSYIYDSAGGITISGPGTLTGSGGFLADNIYLTGTLTLDQQVAFGAGSSIGCVVTNVSATLVGDGTETLTLWVGGTSLTGTITCGLPSSVTVQNLSIYMAGGSGVGSIKLTGGTTINVMKSFSGIGNPGGCYFLSTNTTPVNINVIGPASLPPVLNNVDATYINSFGGRQILDVNGTLSNCNNWTTNAQQFYQNPGWRYNW